MKNVLIIIGKLVVGGAERVGRDIGYYADKKKYNIYYIVFGEESGVYEKELRAKGCKIYHFAPPSENYLEFCRKLNYFIKRKHINVVHSHTMFNSGIVLSIARWNHVPVRIAHSHSIRGPEHRGVIKTAYENFMRKSIIRNATKLVACGKSAGRWLYGEGVFTSKGILIHNGINLEVYGYNEEKRKRIREMYGISGSFVIGHVGHLAAVKNQAFIIKLMPEILKRIPDTMFMIVGDGHDKEMLYELVQNMGMEDHILFTGNVNNVGDYMSAMDVFAFPSLYEGMPLSLVEAQTNGLPCIISDHIPDDVYLTDLIKPLPLENSQSQWIAAVTGTMRNQSEKYKSMMFSKGFDTSVMLEKIYQLYDEI